MSKQTAVEWFAGELMGDLGPALGPELQSKYEQALQMEMEQIVDATCLNKYVNEDDREIGERYYEQTYGKEATNE